MRDIYRARILVVDQLGSYYGQAAKLLTSISDKWLMVVFAYLLAFSVPGIVLGRAVTGVSLIIALLIIFTLPQQDAIWAKLCKTLTSTTAKLIFVTAVVWLVSLKVSSDVTKSLLTEFRSLLFIIGSAAIWSALSTHKHIAPVLLKALVVFCVVLGGVAVFSLIGPFEIIHFIRGYQNTNISSAILLKAAASSSALLIPVLIWAGFRLGGVWIVLSVVAMVELIILIFDTTSRSALAGVLASICAVGLVVIASRQSTKLRVIWVAVMLSCLLVAMAWLAVTRAWTVIGTEEYGWLIPVWLIDHVRQAIWSYAWSASEESRWFGVGINVIDKIPGAQSLNFATNVTNIPLHPHNWIIEIIVETGVVGFVAMIGTIAFCFVSFVGQYIRQKEPAILALIAVWAAYWGSGLFNFSYWSSWWQVSFLLISAVCLACREGVSADVAH